MTMVTPVIIEAAINGVASKARNAHIPCAPDEIARDARACLAAGAAIVHSHNAEMAVGAARAADLYLAAWRPVLAAQADAILYPTIGFGGTIEEKYGHHAILAEYQFVRPHPPPVRTPDLVVRRAHQRAAVLQGEGDTGAHALGHYSGGRGYTGVAFWRGASAGRHLVGVPLAFASSVSALAWHWSLRGNQDSAGQLCSTQRSVLRVAVAAGRAHGERIL